VNSTLLADNSEASLKKFLNTLSAVDEVGAKARVEMLSTRSIKTASKNWAIDLAIRMVDLTTLEGADTPGKVKALCAKGIYPDPTDLTVPSVGAICVYNDMVKIARQALDAGGGKNIPVAAVSTAFPSGRASMEVKIQDTRDAIANGATEIDMVIDRGAFLAGKLGFVFDQIKTITYLAMLAGADFIKTSTGKVAPAATAPVVYVMLEAVRDYYKMTGTRIGVKPAGGIRNTKDAIKQLVLVNEIAGPEWLDPSLFRIGASALLNDLLMQRMKMRDGYYASPNYVTLD